VFPTHPRYGAQAGRENESFLDAAMLREMFLRPLEPYRGKTALVIFEFGALSRRAFEAPAQVLEPLDRFLAALPDGFRYAVEVRTGSCSPRYFGACGRTAWRTSQRLVAHAGRRPRSPFPVRRQFTVCRALLRRGRVYEEAVDAFAPYTRIQDPNPEAREAMRMLISRSADERRMAFLFVNNRLEGNAPLTILSLVEP
jgi:hypothetical protein